MFIKEENILAIMHDNRNYRWAERHFKDWHLISAMTVKIVGDHFVINADISDMYRKHQMVVEMNEHKEVLFYKCTCPFSSLHGGGACGHVAAVLLLLNLLDPQVFPYVYQESDMQDVRDQQRRAEYAKIDLERKRYRESLARSTIESLSQTIEQSYMGLFEKQAIYRLVCGVTVDTVNQALQLKFKVGDEKLYIIKSLNHFFDLIDSEAYYSYGKNLAFYHRLDVFDTFSKETIDLVRHFNNDDAYDNRTLHIYGDDIDAFFDHFLGCDAKYMPLNLSKQPALIELLVIKNDDGTFHVELIDADCYLITQKFVYYQKENSLIQLEENSNAALSHFLLNVVNNRFERIHPDDMEPFNYLLASLSEYINIESQDYVFQNQFEVKSALYVDLQNDEIVLRMECEYEDGSIKNPLIDSSIAVSFSSKAILDYLKLSANYINDGIAFFDLHTELTEQLIFSDLQKMKSLCEVYISDAIKKMSKIKIVSLQLGVSVNNGLLEIDLNSLDFDAKEIRDIMQAFQTKKRYYRLKNGEMLSLDQEVFSDLDDTLSQFHLKAKDIQSDKLKLPLYRAFNIDQLSQGNDLKYQRQDSFNQLLEAFSTKTATSFEIAKPYQDILRTYQKEGVTWMMKLAQYGFGGILADDMGLGKTIQVLALIESLALDKRSIVICPAVLLYNWEDEVKKFSSVIKSICITGNAMQRKELINSLEDETIIITTYDYLRSDIHFYEAMQFEFIVLDEAQVIKNHTTKSAHVVKRLTGKNRLALTGTPIENSLAELWSIFDFLMPNYLYHYNYFQSQFEKPIVKDQDKFAQNRLKSMVEPFILRRTKKEVLLDLPDKLEQTLRFRFSNDEKNLYLAKMAMFNKDLQELMQVEKVNKVMVLAMLTQLRQICCDARLLDGEIKTPSSKLQGCMELIEEQLEANKSILIFSGFTSMLSLIESELKKRYIDYAIITGDVSKQKRKQLVDEFQDGNIPVFLISLKAGGVGLNLTAANTVIHYDPWWNVSAQNQATDRAYRIGQDKEVQVFKLIMKDSIEEKIMLMQERKKDLADIFVEGNKGSIASMNIDQIKELFEQSNE